MSEEVAMKQVHGAQVYMVHKGPWKALSTAAIVFSRDPMHADFSANA